MKTDIFSTRQTQYISKLKPVPKHADYYYFQSLSAKVAWCVSSKPEIVSAMALLLQSKEKRFAEQETKLLKISTVW